MQSTDIESKRGSETDEVKDRHREGERERETGKERACGGVCCMFVHVVLIKHKIEH